MKKNKMATTIIIIVIAIIVLTGSLIAGVYNAVLKPSDFSSYTVPVSGYGTGYFRHCYEELNDNEKKLYSIALPQLYEHSDRVEIPQLVDGDLSKVLKALSYDNPDLFCLGLNCRVYKSGYKFFFEAEYSIDSETYKAQLKQVNEIAQAIADQALQYTDKYEQEKFVHDYIINHCAYTAPSESGGANTAYGCLVEGKAACEGYSRAFQLVLNKLDIDNRIITGEGATDGVNYIAHMWNYVVLDGKGYFVDVTWDDPKGEGAVLTHNYFNVNTTDILREHRSIIQPVPLCTDVEHNYFIRETLYLQVGSGEAFETAVSNAVHTAKYKNQNSVEFRFPNGAVLEQAKNSLFNSGVIYNVYTDAGIFLSSGSGQVYYMTDDTLCTICIFF